jgi:anti-sigma factor RsiW
VQTPCQRIADLLSDYLDGDLGAGERQYVQLHLGVCPGCARFAAELAATVMALHGLGACCGPVLASRDSPTRAGTTSRSTAPPSPERSRPSSS